MSVKELTSKNFDETISNSKKSVLVDFWADWCSPCKMLSPIVEEISKEYSDSVSVYSVNVDSEKVLSERYEIFSIPTVIAFKDGKVVNRISGVQSKDAILSMLNLPVFNKK